MIDVMIITYNESLNLPHCLKALQGWTGKVFVIDSGSTDGTQDIARQFGAEVVHHDWEGYAPQKNWALDSLPFEADWILIVDADEVITDGVRERLLEIAARPVDDVSENGFYINRLTYFLDRPIRHCGYYPSWNLRFFKRGRGRYEDREVHEHVVIDDPVGYVKEAMIHDDRRGLEHYVAKHNRYSTLEARALMREINELQEPVTLTNIPPSTVRRRWLKRVMMPYLPFPWLRRFIYMYIFRLGILDGRAGLEFCKLISTYDYLVALKLAQLRRPSLTPGQVAEPGPGGLRLPEGADPVIPQAPRTEPARSAPARSVTRTAPAAPAAPTAPAGLEEKIRQPEPDRPEPTQVNGEPPAVAALEEGPAVAEPRHPDADGWIEQLDPAALPPGEWPEPGSVPVSVLVPVKNEQRNIVDCLRHVAWADEAVVVDSRSTDATIPLSQAMGADVYQFSYSPDGWPKKKNWALESVPWRNEWVLILDADEIMTPELAEEITRVVRGDYEFDSDRNAGCGDGFWLNRRFMFMGSWIKRCGYYPSYNIRLLRHRRGRYERIGRLGDTGSGDNEVHEHVVLDTGSAGYLKHDFLHYAYPNLTTWIEKHNRYSTWEAFAMEEEMLGQIKPSLFGDPIERRRWIKKIVRKLPFRPTMRFLYSYILQFGFLDGYPGFVMSRLMAWYEFVSIAKHHEMKIYARMERDRALMTPPASSPPPVGEPEVASADEKAVGTNHD